MSDDLDQLSDAALSEVFAVEVLNWKRGINCDGHPAVWPPDCEPYTKRKQGKWPHGVSIGATYAVSADAVLPFLEAAGLVKAIFSKSSALVEVHTGLDWAFGEAPTFARAACVALIRAKRAEEGGKK